MADLNREEMIEIRKTMLAMQDEIHHPGAWQNNNGRDPAELDSDITDALQRLTHAIGPESDPLGDFNYVGSRHHY